MARLVRPPKPQASLVVRFGRWSLALLVLVILLYSLSFYELYAEEKADLATLRSRVAVVYAAPTFHEEVASVVACLLHDLGFYVVVYIGNGWHVGGMMVPFSGRRKRASEEFYGRCVSQFVTITSQVCFGSFVLRLCWCWCLCLRVRPTAPLLSQVKHVTDPDLMVFVTYPMTERGGKPDKVRGGPT